MNKSFLFFIFFVTIISVYYIGAELTLIKWNTLDEFDKNTVYLNSDKVTKKFLEKYSGYGKVDKLPDSSPLFVDVNYTIRNQDGNWIKLKTATWAGFIIFQNIVCTPNDDNLEQTQYYVSDVMNYLQNYNCFDDKYSNS